MPVETQSETAWKYAKGRVSLFPYLASSADPSFPEDFLLKLYLQTKEEGFLGLLFPGMSPMTMSKFIAYFHSNPMVVGVVESDDPDKPLTVAGYGWLWNIEGTDGARKASAGFAFFKKFRGGTEIREIARLAVSYWFTENKIDIIYGATLKSNRLAQAFDRELGFNKVAELPMYFSHNGRLEDAVIVTQTRTEFEEVCHRWT